MSGRPHDPGRLLGFTLLEVLVAAAIFSTVLATAFVIFAAARRSYMWGENLADRQQGTRVAFARLVADVRMAGFNYDPAGARLGIDEPVEGAWDTAITLRADFDFADPIESAIPEESLSRDAGDIVTIGNDEIVTYVLARPGPVGRDRLVLHLDADRPRSGRLRNLTIRNVVLEQSDPPYTLYRVTLADRPGVFPADPAGRSGFLFEPIADDIRALTFRYYGGDGVLLGPGTPEDPSDDIGGDEALRPNRTRIRQIAIRLVGMDHQQDLGYDDGDPATTARHHRKFELSSLVSLRNPVRGRGSGRFPPTASPGEVSLNPLMRVGR